MTKDQKINCLNEIGFLLHQNNCAMKARRNRDVEEIGLTSSQMDILLYLLYHKEKPIYQVDLEKVFRLSNPTVTGLLKRLEAKEFVNRVQVCEDKRCKQIIATKKAEEVEKFMCNRRDEANKAMFKDFSDEEISQFLRLSQKAHDNIAKEKKQHD